MSDRVKMWLMFYGPVYTSCLAVAVLIGCSVVQEHQRQAKLRAEQREVWVRTYAAYN